MLRLPRNCFPSARALVALALVLWGAQAWAVQLRDLYEAEVSVATRDRPERQEALQAALAQVLTKITGMRDVAGIAELQPLLESAPRYVQQFRYRETPGATAPFALQVSFDGQALERAVADQGLPVWGRERPAVLVWLAVQEPGRRYLVGGDSGGAARAALDAAARERGVPLVYPLLDIEDQGKVSFADVSGGFEETVVAGSQRYRPDAVLTGSAFKQGGQWSARWRLRFGDQSMQWEARGETLEMALSAGVNELAGTLAARLATAGPAGFAAGTLVIVSGVKDLADYVKVSSYLGGLAPVVSSRLYRAAPDRAEYLVVVRGDARDLERIVGLGDVLARERSAPLAVPPVGPVQTPVEPELPTLRFRLL